MSSYLAFPSLPHKCGGIFLLHFPWSRLRRTLSGTLPCGARTFLIRSGRMQSPVLLAKYILNQIYLEYNILPQFSHSTMPEPEATFFTMAVGRDMRQPLHWLFSTVAMGRAWFA